MLEIARFGYDRSMKNVLLPTDFSSQSRYSLEYVLGFLQHTMVPSRVLLVNTYILQMSADPLHLVSINDELKKKSKGLLDKEVFWARAHCLNPLVTIEAASHMGTLNNVILNLLRREDIDLVAMGKGNGNHVDQVASLLKLQNCPLLITYRPETTEVAEA
jgi:nucleotide-binding universal stress UspA family protein